MIKKTGSLLRNAPDIPTLHQLLAKCFQQPGEKLQVSWRSAENQLFVLDVIYSLKDRRPNWQLVSEKSGRRILIADYAGHDILMVYKQISTAANNAMDERSGEESNRVSRTRDARAAAANWLESKVDSGGDDGGKKQPLRPEIRVSSASTKAGANQGFWQDDQQETWQGAQQESRQKMEEVAAALEESPWNKTSNPAELSNNPQPAAPTASSSSSSSTSSRAGSASAAPSQNKSAPAESAKPISVKAPSSSSSGSPTSQSSPASSTSAKAVQPMPPAASMPPAAPVKVTGPGPQATAPKPLPAQASPGKPQTPAALTSKDRSAIAPHPDKGATSSDPKPASTAPVAPVKKHSSPEKITAAPKRISENPDLVNAALPLIGELDDTSVAKLLNQFKSAQVTGRMEFADGPLTALVFIEEGKPVEAWMGDLKGDSALLELLLWTSGTYSVTIGMTATNRNVKSTPEELVEHNKNITTLLQELAEEGLTPTSTFAPSNPLLSSEAFDRMATPEAPMELEKLAKLYVKLDGKKTFADLNELHILPRPVLVQAIHHLYYSSIIDILNPKQAHKEKVVVPKTIDGAAIQSVMMTLRRLDTGLFIYPAFLYFLEEEFFRIYRAKNSMSILIFEMRELAAGDGLVRRVSLSSDAIADAAMRIGKCKRHTDVVAHYEANDFAILLPNTGSGGTKVFANKVVKALTESPLTGTEGKKLSFSFGAASMPEDFKDLSMLLGAAEMAMNFARQRGKPLVMFKDMEV